MWISGYLVNSGKFKRIRSDEAAVEIMDYIEEMRNTGKEKSILDERLAYFQTKRYSGDSIPIIYCNDCRYSHLYRRRIFSVILD